MATLPGSALLWMDLPFWISAARRLRSAFVADGMLSTEQAKAAVFNVRSAKTSLGQGQEESIISQPG